MCVSPTGGSHRNEGEAVTTATTDHLLTTEQLAEYLGLSESFVRKSVHARRIPFVKVGAAVRFRRGEIDAWLNDNATAAR